MISHHDLKIYDETSIREITDKYKRRFARFKNLVKEEQNIKFIRYCQNSEDIEEDEIILFCDNVRRINNNLLFAFILISDCDGLIIPDSLMKMENFIYVNLNEYIDAGTINEKNGYVQTLKKYKCVFSLFA